MKRLHSIAAFILSAALFTQADAAHAKDKVIERPTFTSRNTKSIEVSRIVLSDTATIVNIYVKYQPKYWIRIAKESILTDNNGREYALRGADGITPGERLYMPESGETEFSLIFAPIDPKASSVCFSENVEDGWSICGIQTDGCKPKGTPELPSGITAHKPDKKTALPAPACAYGTATVKGRLLDYCPRHSDSFLRQNQFGTYTAVNRMPEKIDIKSDGSFSFSIPVAGTVAENIYVPVINNGIKVFLEPGKTTEVYINTREYSRRDSKYHKDDKPYGLPLYVKGPLAVVAQEFAMYGDAAEAGTDTEIKGGMSPTDYKALIMKARSEIEAKLQNLPFSRATREFIRLNTDLETAAALNNIHLKLGYAMLDENKITRNQFESYTDSLKKTMPENFIPREIIAQINTPYSVISLSDIFGRINKTEAAELLGTDSGPYFANTEAKKLYFSITSDFRPLDNEQKAIMAVLPEAHRTMIEKANDDLLKSMEERKAKTGYAIRETPTVADSLLFDSIAARYRGKVVLIDIWETWCGPCRLGHERMASMKKVFAGNKNVAFVYLASESSPEGQWKYMISDITGDHYRLTFQQKNVIQKLFNTSGVPTYVILDRNGKTVYKHIGYPGTDTIKAEIDKNLLSSNNH